MQVLHDQDITTRSITRREIVDASGLEGVAGVRGDLGWRSKCTINAATPSLPPELFLTCQVTCTTVPTAYAAGNLEWCGSHFPRPSAYPKPHHGVRIAALGRENRRLATGMHSKPSHFLSHHNEYGLRVCRTHDMTMLAR